MDLKEDNNLSIDTEASNWWIKTRFLYVLRSMKYLKRKKISVMDFGSGTGVNSYLMRNDENIKKIVAVDNMYSDTGVFVWKTEKHSFLNAKPQEKFDLILAMDVLEHVEDDKGTLERLIGENLVEDGVVLITVPAFRFLWSEHDVLLEHKRRYVKKDFDHLLKGLPIKVLDLKYSFHFILPVLYLVRKFKKSNNRPELPECSWLTNKLLYVLGFLEEKMPVSFFGTSVVCIIKKEKL